MQAGRQYRMGVQDRVAVLASLKIANEAPPALLDWLFNAVGTFEGLRADFDGVEGSLHSQEGHCLYHFARFGPRTGAIVEVGSLCERSTCWLAAGTRDATREKVIAVSHFHGLSERQHCEAPSVLAINQSGTTLSSFLANLQTRGLREWVDLRLGPLAEAGSTWQGPIRLLYFDADQNFRTTVVDMERWCRHVVPGGLVAFRDILDRPVTTDFYRRMLGNNQKWMEICKIRSLRVVRRRV